jgi:hypothetical protein
LESKTGKGRVQGKKTLGFFFSFGVFFWSSWTFLHDQQQNIHSNRSLKIQTAED